MRNEKEICFFIHPEDQSDDTEHWRLIVFDCLEVTAQFENYIVHLMKHTQEVGITLEIAKNYFIGKRSQVNYWSSWRVAEYVRQRSLIIH